MSGIRARLVQIDAFAERLFEGNPAAVVPLATWPADDLLQRIAQENNLSETAFLVADLPPAAASGPARRGRWEPGFHLRWFTPAVEVDLCGHATLAAGFFVLDDVHPDADVVWFWTRSGWLSVERAAAGRLTMSLPSGRPVPTPTDPAVERALGVPVRESLLAMDLVCVLDSPDAVGSVRPDLGAIVGNSARGVIITAEGADSGYDFVSRFFAPGVGVPEDPVTGSAHAQIAPMWAERLGRSTLIARQLSARGGTVHCRVEGDRTLLTGSCVPYLDGLIRLDP